MSRFNSIMDAIHYAQDTGDNQPLFQYVSENGDKMVRKFLTFMQSATHGEGEKILFLTAFLEQFTKITRSTLSQEEQLIIDKLISPSFSMTAIRMPYIPPKDQE